MVRYTDNALDSCSQRGYNRCSLIEQPESENQDEIEELRVVLYKPDVMRVEM